jgi:hypothetical protein
MAEKKGAGSRGTGHNDGVPTLKTGLSLRALFKDIRPVWISALASLTLSILIVEFSHWFSFQSALQRWVFGVAAVASVVAPGVLVVTALRKTFRFESRTTLLGSILACYFFVIVVFAGVYYAMSGLGDLIDAEHAYEYYSEQRQALEDGTISRAFPRDSHLRQFNGIEERLWVSVKSCIPTHIPREETVDTVHHLLAATVTPFRDCMAFEGRNRIPVFIASLHFSIVTMTTLGYGDITPARTLSRLAADLQILSSITLFTLGLGMVFGGLLDRPPKS